MYKIFAPIVISIIMILSGQVAYADELDGLNSSSVSISVDPAGPNGSFAVAYRSGASIRVTSRDISGNNQCPYVDPHQGSRHQIPYVDLNAPPGVSRASQLSMPGLSRDYIFVTATIGETRKLFYKRRYSLYNASYCSSDACTPTPWFAACDPAGWDPSWSELALPPVSSGFLGLASAPSATSTVVPRNFVAIRGSEGRIWYRYASCREPECFSHYWSRWASVNDTGIMEVGSRSRGLPMIASVRNDRIDRTPIIVIAAPSSEQWDVVWEFRAREAFTMSWTAVPFYFDAAHGVRNPQLATACGVNSIQDSSTADARFVVCQNATDGTYYSIRSDHGNASAYGWSAMSPAGLPLGIPSIARLSEDWTSAWYQTIVGGRYADFFISPFYPTHGLSITYTNQPFVMTYGWQPWSGAYTLP